MRVGQQAVLKFSLGRWSAPIGARRPERQPPGLAERTSPTTGPAARRSDLLPLKLGCTSIARSRRDGTARPLYPATPAHVRMQRPAGHPAQEPRAAAGHGASTRAAASGSSAPPAGAGPRRAGVRPATGSTPPAAAPGTTRLAAERHQELGPARGTPHPCEPVLQQPAVEKAPDHRAHHRAQRAVGRLVALFVHVQGLEVIGQHPVERRSCGKKKKARSCGWTGSRGAAGRAGAGPPCRTSTAPGAPRTTRRSWRSSGCRGSRRAGRARARRFAAARAAAPALPHPAPPG